MKAKNSNGSVICPFCGANCVFRYRMNGFDIMQCKKCNTGQAFPMPSIEELRLFYNGFIPNLSLKDKHYFDDSAKRLLMDLGLKPGNNLQMLDIGGGSGFFCKAFEDMGYGESTYVDLDPQSCEFAKKEVGLERVFNCDAIDLARHTETKFDFIYSRHLIEHLLEPLKFLSKVMENLNDRGIFVVQFPNGNSLEYLPYLPSVRKYRFAEIRKSNNYSKFKLFCVFMTGGMLHGIFPPRHLWAITKKGIRTWCKNNNIDCAVQTYHLGCKAYTPGWKKDKNYKVNIRYFLGQKLFSPIYGGTHLVAILRR